MGMELKSALESIREISDGAAAQKQTLADVVKMVDELAKQSNRQRMGGFVPDETGGDTATKQIAEFVTRGTVDGMQTKELNALSGATGGYSVVPELDSRIFSRGAEVAPIWTASEKATTVSNRYDRSYTNGASVAVRVAEAAARAETTSPTLAQVQVPLSVLFHNTKLSEESVNSSASDLVSFVVEENAIAFSEKWEAEAIASIVAAATSTVGDATRAFPLVQKLVTAGSGVVVYDDVVKLIHTLAPRYRRNAALFASTAACEALRLLKSSDAMPLWRDGNLTTGAPASLMGYPVIECAQMPGVATGLKPIFFADMQRAHLFVSNQNGFGLLRDDVTLKGFVQLYNRIMCGNAVSNSRAIKVLEIKA